MRFDRYLHLLLSIGVRELRRNKFDSKSITEMDPKSQAQQGGQMSISSGRFTQPKIAQYLPEAPVREIPKLLKD